MFVIISCVVGVYSVFPVRAIDALLRCLHPFTSPYQPHPPVNVHYLHICGVRDVTLGGVRSTQFGLCGCVARNSLHVWHDRALDVLSLNSQKMLTCATEVRLKVRFSLTVTVTITVRVSVSAYGYSSAWSYCFAFKLEGNHHHTCLWKIETRLLSTPPSVSFTQAVDMYVSGGRGSRYVNKGGK